MSSGLLKLVWAFVLLGMAAPGAMGEDSALMLRNKSRLASFLRDKGLDCRTVERISEGELEDNGRTYRVLCAGSSPGTYRLVLQADGRISVERPRNYQ